MRLILIIISAIIADEICWRLIIRSVKGYARRKERIYDMSKYKEDSYRINKQTVYKVDGDFNGDIKGDNVTVILMGNGNFNGDINSKDGEVVVVKGNINGDVKANKVLCPTDPKQVKCSDCVHAQKQRFISLSGNREYNVCSQFGVKVDDNYRNCQLYKPIKHNENNLASPYERIDFVYDGDKCVNRYKSLALANVTCPHCRKSFSKDFKVVTTVIDGEVSNTEIENYGGYILD